MKKYLLLCVFISLSSNVIAQKYQIRGRVVSEIDSTAISQAIVSCHPDSLQKWEFTDEKGGFVINNISLKSTKLSVSCVGYKKIYIPLKLNKNVIDLGVIILPVEIYEVEDVVVQSKIPLMERYGDTIQYNATAFKVNEEWNALDLIRRFPGVFIFNNEIVVNGKPLLKILLDGKEYENADVFQLLMNIPASVINNVQSYDKESNHARLTGFKNGREEGALNIRTKNPLGIKMWVNASGEDGLNTNGKVNNLYGIKGSGTFDNPTHRLLANLNVTNGGVGNNESPSVGSMPLIVTKPYLRSIGNNKGMNFVYDYSKKKFKFDLNGSLFDSQKSGTLDGYQSYFPVATMFDSKMIVSNSQNRRDAFAYNVHCGMEWTISEKLSLSLNNGFKNDSSENRSSKGEIVFQDGDSVSRSEIIALKNDRSKTLRGSGAFYYRISPEKRTLSISFHYYINFSDMSDRPQRYMDEIYDKELMSWKSANSNSNIKQLTTSGRRNYTADLSYYEAVAEGHQLRLNFTYESKNDSKLRSAYLYSDIMDDYSLFSQTRSNYSDVGTRSADVFLGYEYTKSKKNSVSASISLLGNEQTIDDLLNPRYNVKANVLIPEGGIIFSRKFTPTTTVRFEYGSIGTMPDAQDLVPIIDDRNLSNISIGNPNLKSSRSHNFSVNYLRIKNSSLTAKLSFEMRNNAIVRLTEFMPINRDTVIYAVNIPADTAGKGYIPQRGAVLARTENRSGGVRFTSSILYGINIEPISSTLSASLRYYFTKVNAYDGKDDFIRNNNVQFGLSLASTISKDIDLSLVYDGNYSKRSMSGSNSFTTFTNGVGARISYSFFKRMYLSASGIWYHEVASDSRIPTDESVCVDLDLGVYLNRRRNFRFSVKGDNLLNNGDGISRNQTDTYYILSNNNGFYRSMSLSLSYKFNNMTKTPKLKKGEVTNSGGFFNK